MMREILVMDREGCETFWLTLKTDWKILFASTAREGLSMVSGRIGLIFINWRLPDMDGADALELIKRAYPSTPVVVVTSSGTEETCMEAFRKGARDYMRKPLNAEEILQKIEMLAKTNDRFPQRRHICLSMKSMSDEPYPHIPSQFIDGVLRVKDYISQNYSESLTLSAACKMASLCKTYFCRYFKRVTGHSLRHYHHVVRIRIAEELLRDKRLSITDVAIRLGYDDPNYFSTIYKKISGVPPREWQATYQKVFREKEELAAAEVPGDRESPDVPAESTPQGAPKEWQAAYQYLYREKEEPGMADLPPDKAGPSLHSIIADVPPRCRKAAARGLDRIKKLNEDFDRAFEYFEP